MTLGQAFTRAIELEAGYQLSEGVSLARPTEVIQVQEVDEIGAGQRKSRDVVCWQCGEKGHLQHDCPYKMADDQVEGMDDPHAYAGRSEQIIRINQPITVATRDNICGITRTTRQPGWTIPEVLQLFSGNFVITCSGRTASKAHHLIFRCYIIDECHNIICDVTAPHMHWSCDLLL